MQKINHLLYNSHISLQFTLKSTGGPKSRGTEAWGKRVTPQKSFTSNGNKKTILQHPLQSVKYHKDFVVTDNRPGDSVQTVTSVLSPS